MLFMHQNCAQVVLQGSLVRGIIAIYKQEASRATSSTAPLPLRNKLIGPLGLRTLLLVILIPGLAALIYTTANTLSIQRQTAEQDLSARVRAMSQLVDYQLLRAQHGLDLIAETSPPQPGAPLEEYHEVLLRARKTMPYLDGIILADPNGVALLASTVSPGVELPALTGAARLKEAAKRGKGGPGPVFFGNLSQRWIVTIDSPIRRDGKVVFMLQAVIATSRMRDLLEQQAIPDKWIATIFDMNATVAARTAQYDETVGKPASAWVRGHLKDGVDDVVGVGKSIEGIPFVSAMHKSVLTGYGVVAGLPKELVDAPARKALWANSSALAAALLLGLWLAWLFAARLRADIRQLEDATKAVANGQHDVSVPLSGSAELRQLSGYFEAMVRALRKSEKDLAHSVTHDQLTGLGNRVLLADHLDTEIARAQRSDTMTAVFLLDLDRFALVNDSLTHSVGDAVLLEVAIRLKATVRPSDFIARLGGDEFVIVAPELCSESEAASLAFRVMHALQVPIEVQSHVLTVTASIGITVATRDGDKGETLLMNAEGAMFKAKESGSNQFQFFASDMNRKVQGRLSLESGLRKALEDGQLTLHYQPRVELATGDIVGVEALVRWRHPERGIISPAEFIPIAEESGLIAPLGRWVLERACYDAKKWCDQGHPLIVGVNVSVRQFQYGDLANIIEAALRKTGLSPAYLELELTESAVMLDPAKALKLLHDLKMLGIRLALDDFGTGYSSLAHLKRLPVDVLKIDQSFIRDISESAVGEVMVKTIISLGHNLRQEVLAKGVETEAQADFLRAQGCDLGQGFLFGKPLPLPELLETLRQQKRGLGMGSGAFQRSNFE